MPIAFARSAASENRFMISESAIAETPAEEQEAAEGKHVGVHDPDERGLGEAQIRLDRGQGHVHDRRVEDDHQVPEAEDDKRQPALPAAFECQNISPWLWVDDGPISSSRGPFPSRESDRPPRSDRNPRARRTAGPRSRLLFRRSRGWESASPTPSPLRATSPG